MSETERRRNYHHNRILIETARILSPAFADATVFLSGAQLEMLRNVSQYLNRQETYVTEYNPGYYLMPTVADYDDILEIVADLEETLMGNPNTIWGYADRWEERVTHIKVGDGHHNLESAAVADGYVHMLHSLTVRNQTTAFRTIPKLRAGSVEVAVGPSETVGAGGYRVVLGLSHTLKYTDLVVTRFYDCLDGDFLEMLLWGYKMIVPES